MSRRPTESSRLGTGHSMMPFSGLPQTTVPLDQLQQIQKRLHALVLSTGQLQMEVAMAPTLDWPTILSRFGTLVSQTYSLSSSLTSQSSAFLPSQIDDLNRFLEEEAKRENYFLQEDEGDEQGGTFGVGEGTSGAGNVPRVRYTDLRNPLPKLAAVPVAPLDAADKVGRLGEALRTKLDPDVAQRHEEDLQEDRSKRSASLVPPPQHEGEQPGDVLLRSVLLNLQDHDRLARRALRAWHHVRWRPDEDGQTYDFKMRLADDDAGQVDDMESEAEVEEVDVQGANRSEEMGGGNEEDVQAEDLDQEAEDDDEDDDEMEDIDIS